MPDGGKVRFKLPAWQFNLRFKIMAAVVAVLFVVISSIFAWQYFQIRESLIKRVGIAATPLSDVIKASLKFAMESRSLYDVEEIVANVSQQPGVERVLIFDKKGYVRISGDGRDLGRKFEMSDRTCQICHRSKAESRSRTIIFQASSGYRIFRNVNPIENGPECHGCHDPSAKLNGVLITDFSMAEVDREMDAKFRQILLFLLITLSTTIVTIGFIVNRLVISKVRRIAKTTRLLIKGDLNHRLEIDSRDEIGELASSFNKMVESLRRLKEIRERKELLENVLNNVKDSIIILEREGTIISFSRGAEEMFGYRSQEVLGTSYLSFGPERKMAWNQALAGQVFAGEVRMRRKDGSKFPAFFTLTPLKDEKDQLLALVEVATDLTEEKTRQVLQKQLVHSEKLAAAGRLAAGVAHELNNPLGNILLYSKLLLEESDPADPSYRNLQKIVDNVARSKKIVSDLLDYTRQSEIKMELNQINEIAEKTMAMMRNEMKINNVEGYLYLEEGLPKVPCDRSQIQQVLVNLVQNAIEASTSGGRIEVFSKLNNNGKAVQIGVRDNGRGIPREIAAKIFEPFFTTKDKGTGLGLSICYGIVKRHNGRIWVENGSGQETVTEETVPAERWSTFIMELPVPGYK